jgi:threonine dehydratase
MANVFVGISSNGEIKDRAALIEHLQPHDFKVVDMTTNELAKEHIRYMVGGHAPYDTTEVIYSVEFPERPNALLNFLTELGGRWNISLFHYRNHGAAFGKVLMGLQIESVQQKDFHANNPAYRLFSGGKSN